MLLSFVCKKNFLIKTFWFDETVSRLKSFFIEHIRFKIYIYITITSNGKNKHTKLQTVNNLNFRMCGTKRDKKRQNYEVLQRSACHGLV